MSNVNVYNEQREVIARVEYSSNLDYWDGRNWTCGGVGRHKGITRLRDGRYVLIHGTQWQGEKDWAEVITAKEALQEILRSDNDNMLEWTKFKDLAKLAESMAEEYA